MLLVDEVILLGVDTFVAITVGEPTTEDDVILIDKVDGK